MFPYSRLELEYSKTGSKNRKICEVNRLNRSSALAYRMCYDDLPVVFIVSPNNWNLALSPRRTPAITGPECNPTRRPSSDLRSSTRRRERVREDAGCDNEFRWDLTSYVSGPSVVSKYGVSSFILYRQSRAKRAMMVA